MLMRLLTATVVAVVVYLICVLAGMLLSELNVPIASTIGDFLTGFAVVIGVLAGIWHFAGGSLHIGGA